MKKYKAGNFCFDAENNYDYYTDDFETFYELCENDDIELSEEDLENWAVWLNSPWSQDHEKYIIELNCKDAYTPMDKNEPKWKCEYFIVGYDGISAAVFGYGNTETEALAECKKHFQMLQNKYNPKGDSL